MGPKAAHVVVFNREKGLLEEEKIHPGPPPPPPPALTCAPAPGSRPGPVAAAGCREVCREGREGRLCGGLANGPRSGSATVSKALVPRCRGSKVKSV